MSRTNHHGKRSRGWKYHQRHPYRGGTAPGWWTNLFMSRPRRLGDRAMLRRVANGRLDADGAAFALGNRKPHKYYW